MRISDWSSDVCSSDLEYEVRTVDANNRDEIARINPWGRVPALVLGSGTVLTETVAILFHVADRVPARHLLPPSGSAERFPALSFLTLLALSVHIAFRPVLRPDRLEPPIHAQADVRSTGDRMPHSVQGGLGREFDGDRK